MRSFCYFELFVTWDFSARNMLSGEESIPWAASEGPNSTQKNGFIFWAVYISRASASQNTNNSFGNALKVASPRHRIISTDPGKVQTVFIKLNRSLPHTGRVCLSIWMPSPVPCSQASSFLLKARNAVPTYAVIWCMGFSVKCPMCYTFYMNPSVNKMLDAAPHTPACCFRHSLACCGGSWNAEPSTWATGTSKCQTSQPQQFSIFKASGSPAQLPKF